MRRKYRIQIIVALSIAILGMGVAGVGINRTKSKIEEIIVRDLEERLRYAMIQCYILEGKYPSQITYLETEYGVAINTLDYKVTYEYRGEHKLPHIAVQRIGEMPIW